MPEQNPEPGQRDVLGDHLPHDHVEIDHDQHGQCEGDRVQQIVRHMRGLDERINELSGSLAFATSAAADVFTREPLR